MPTASELASGLTADRIRDIVEYNPENGEFRWREKISCKCNIGGVAGTTKKCGYVFIGINGTRFRAHRLAWKYMTGEWPSDEIDHKDRNRSNNAFANLRPATHRQNMANSSRKRNLPRGVTRHRGKFIAWLSVNGRTRYLGIYETAAEAASRRNHAALLEYGEFMSIS